MQPQMHLKRIKIAITVQKRESPLNDECRDQTVYGLPYRDPLLTQSAIAFSALEGNLGSTNRVNRKLEKCLPCSVEVLLAAIPLKHLAQDDITEGNGLPAQGRMQQIGLGGDLTAKVVDPDR